MLQCVPRPGRTSGRRTPPPWPSNSRSVTVAAADAAGAGRVEAHLARATPARPVFTPAGHGDRRGKTYDAEAAAAEAAALLSAAGGGPLTAAAGRARPAAAAVRLVKNSIGMTFVRVAAGTFRMGSPDDETGHREHEGPVHEVQITRPFYLSVLPVTQGQYEAVKGKNPSKFNRAPRRRAGPPGRERDLGPGRAVLRAAVDDARRGGPPPRLPAADRGRVGIRLPGRHDHAVQLRRQADRQGRGVRRRRREVRRQEHRPGRPSCRRTPGACTTCTATCRSGCRTGSRSTTTSRARRTTRTGRSGGMLQVVRGGCWGMLATDCRSAARRGHDPEAPVRHHRLPRRDGGELTNRDCGRLGPAYLWHYALAQSFCFVSRLAFSTRVQNARSTFGVKSASNSFIRSILARMYLSIFAIGHRLGLDHHVREHFRLVLLHSRRSIAVQEARHVAAGGGHGWIVLKRCAPLPYLKSGGFNFDQRSSS